jgi:hypothetical protein
VAAALMAQKRTHEAVGYACVRSAERLLGAASLAPITRLRDALRRLRPIMEKRRRYQTDVDAYNRRVSGLVPSSCCCCCCWFFRYFR